MSFGENLQNLRRRDGITQENLAERLSVSRQTVSKWESDGAFPEMDKLIVLCEMFGVTMDDMVRGSVGKDDAAPAPCGSSGIGKDEYLRHYKRFAGEIAGGVMAILFGIGLMMLFASFLLPEWTYITVFFLFLILGVVLFISGGIGHDSFIKNDPVWGFEFTRDEIAAEDRRFARQLIVGITGILLGVLMIVALSLAFPQVETDENVAMTIVSVFFFILSVSVGLIVYTGIIKDSYGLEESKKKNTEKEALKERISGTIMSIATALFLILGFVWDLWHPGWVVFPIGGIICGIVSNIIGD